MSFPKEGPPLNTADTQYLVVEDLVSVLTKVGVPTPLQERIMKEMASTAASSPEELLASVSLEIILEDLPAEVREKLEKRAIEILKSEVDTEAKQELREEAKTELRDELMEEMGEVLRERAREELGPLFDVYLGEVSGRVFGFRLGELSGQERHQIEDIRTGLEIPGKFNPDAK